MRPTHFKAHPQFTSIILAVFGSAAFTGAHAATITFFAPSAFSANTATMDTTLGITSYAIENFEDTTLIPGLTISFNGNGYNATRTALTATLTRTDTAFWDGNHFMENHPDNTDFGNTPPLMASLVTFNYAAGATSFGVGLISFQSVNPPADQFPITDHRLYLNGVPFAQTLEQLAGANWFGSAFGRNGFIRIDAAQNETITSVGFENISGNDVIIFDHAAVRAVPEPSAVALLLIGALTQCSRRRNPN